MKHGSLFSGYGGLDMAIEEVLGARTAWVSDIDPGAYLTKTHKIGERVLDAHRARRKVVKVADMMGGAA